MGDRSGGILSSANGSCVCQPKMIGIGQPHKTFPVFGFGVIFAFNCCLNQLSVLTLLSGLLVWLNLSFPLPPFWSLKMLLQTLAGCCGVSLLAILLAQVCFFGLVRRGLFFGRVRRSCMAVRLGISVYSDF